MFYFHYRAERNLLETTTGDNSEVGHISNIIHKKSFHSGATNGFLDKTHLRSVLNVFTQVCHTGSSVSQDIDEQDSLIPLWNNFAANIVECQGCAMTMSGKLCLKCLLSHSKQPSTYSSCSFFVSSANSCKSLGARFYRYTPSLMSRLLSFSSDQTKNCTCNNFKK